MPSFDQLIQSLTDTTQPIVVRSSAIEVLVAQGDTRSVGFLIETLSDSDSMIRREAAKALQDLGATGAIDPLLEALQVESKDLTVWAMLEAIGELGNPNVLSTLEPLSNVDSMLTRIEVKKCISKIRERYGNENTLQQLNREETVPAQKHTTQLSESTLSAETPRPDLDAVEVEEAEEGTEAEFSENPMPDVELPEPDEDSEIHDPGPSEPEEDTEIHKKKYRDPDEDREINDLVKSISQSPRLAGSSVALPVLAPNAATVPYHPNVAPSEEKNENFFLAVLHPGRYLSKRWVSRTRVYLILWGILLAATIGFMQYQKYRGAKETPLLRMGLSATEVPDLAKRSLAEGDFYIQEGHYKQAISAYQLSRDLEVLPIHLYRKLGFAYFKEGQYALAVEAYELFLEERENVPPDVFTAEASLSGMYPTTSVKATVVQDYETYNILGTAYMKLERLQDAQRIYEEAIRLAPKYGEAYNNLARLYVDSYQQKLNLAETLAYTAVTLNPNVAAYHDTLGWVLAKRGQMNKAMKALERSINLQSDAVEAHYHLAQVALKAGERKKAIKSIRNVLKLNPAYVHLNVGTQEP